MTPDVTRTEKEVVVCYLCDDAVKEVTLAGTNAGYSTWNESYFKAYADDETFIVPAERFISAHVNLRK